MGRKKELYAEFGAREFWAISQQRRQVEVFRLGPDGKYEAAIVRGPGERMETALLPGFKLEIDDLYAGVL